MPTLVHLADEREAQKLLKGGIKIGKYRQGIYCMPVLQNFYVTHQWLRELKRRGVKTYVGIYFKVDSSQLVFAGHYNENHRHITLGEAIKDIMSLQDPLGYELIIDRKIEPTEITKIKNLPQNIGWRYSPTSKGKYPCTCEYCMKSGINDNKTRQRFDPPNKVESYEILLSKIEKSKDADEVANLLAKIQGKIRRADPTKLMFLLDQFSDFENVELATTLGKFRHKNTEQLLISLLSHKDPNVRDSSAEGILKIKGKEGVKILNRFSNDPVIKNVIEDFNS